MYRFLIFSFEDVRGQVKDSVALCHANDLPQFPQTDSLYGVFSPQKQVKSMVTSTFFVTGYAFMR